MKAAVMRANNAPLELEQVSISKPQAHEVLVRTVGGAVVRGELRSAGTDVARVRVDGEPPTPVGLPVGSIALLVLHP